MNAFEVLGIEPTMDMLRIKSRYRRLCMSWHPDRNPGNAEAAEQMVKIQKAYDQLCDEATRKVIVDGLTPGPNGDILEYVVLVTAVDKLVQCTRLDIAVNMNSDFVVTQLVTFINEEIENLDSNIKNAGVIDKNLSITLQKLNAGSFVEEHLTRRRKSVLLDIENMNESRRIYLNARRLIKSRDEQVESFIKIGNIL